MNPKYEKFIKKNRNKTKTSEEKNHSKEENHTQSRHENQEQENQKKQVEEPASLFQIFKNYGNPKWLQQNHPQARASFNVFNLSKHPERPKADAIAIVPIKGTTFPDKRDACIQEATDLEKSISSGEVELRPEPNNPHDPNALAIFSHHSKKHLGYVPKVSEINKTYIEAINAGMFTGAFIIEAKKSLFNGSPSALLILATGWKNQKKS